MLAAEDKANEQADAGYIFEQYHQVVMKEWLNPMPVCKQKPRSRHRGTGHLAF
jgi:hypothetical protein